MQLSLKEKQEKEALTRLTMLHVMPEVKSALKQGVVYYSERQNEFFNATLYYVSNNENFVNIMKEFEKKTNAKVYHMQLTHTSIGDMLSILYVSAYEEEWEQDKEDLKNGLAYVKVVNLDYEPYSDYGMIGVKGSFGGVARTA